MPYVYKFSPSLDKQLRKLKKRDLVLFSRIQKKVLEIVDEPESYKTLQYTHGRYKRVHIDPFVLLFTIEGNRIEFLLLEHHDKAYAR